MIVRKTIIALCVGLTFAAGAGPVLASAHHHHAPALAGDPAPSFAPPRMIEVRPGLWVGSYQCITDLERGGRDCSSGI
jgi:hypothetical protein